MLPDRHISLQKFDELCAQIESRNIENIKSILISIFEEVREKRNGILILSEDEEAQIKTSLSRLVEVSIRLDQLDPLLNILSNESEYGRNSRLIREINLYVLERLWDKGKSDDIRQRILSRGVQLEGRFDAASDIDMLFRLRALYKQMGEKNRVGEVDIIINTNLAGRALPKFANYLATELETRASQTEEKIHAQDSSVKELQKDTEELKKDKVRLIETLGLFAAIIAFVVAGVVGLKGLNSAAIAITLTGLTACLTVLVMLIHIFTNKDDRKWKIAILIVALCVLVLWVLATVAYHIAKLVWG